MSGADRMVPDTIQMRVPMLRFMTLSCGLALLAGAASAETEAQKAERCAAQADIVTQAVDARAQGRDAPGTKEMLTAADSRVPARYAPGITPLVEWVFTLPQDQLTLDVGGAFEKQCLEFSQ